METAAIKASGSNKYTPFTRKLTAVYTRATLEVSHISLMLSGMPPRAARLHMFHCMLVEKALHERPFTRPIERHHQSYIHDQVTLS